MSHRGRKIVDDSKAGGEKIKKGRVIESDRKRGNERDYCTLTSSLGYTRWCALLLVSWFTAIQEI